MKLKYTSTNELRTLDSFTRYHTTSHTHRRTECVNDSLLSQLGAVRLGIFYPTIELFRSPNVPHHICIDSAATKIHLWNLINTEKTIDEWNETNWEYRYRKVFVSFFRLFHSGAGGFLVSMLKFTGATADDVMKHWDGKKCKHHIVRQSEFLWILFQFSVCASLVYYIGCRTCATNVRWNKLKVNLLCCGSQVLVGRRQFQTVGQPKTVPFGTFSQPNLQQHD